MPDKPPVPPDPDELTVKPGESSGTARPDWAYDTCDDPLEAAQTAPTGTPQDR